MRTEKNWVYDLFDLVDKKVNAFMKAKADGVLSGLFAAEKVFRKLDESIEWHPKFNDGDRINAGDILVEFSGSFIL